MLALFDHCTPQGIIRYLVGHTVKTARRLGWAELKNGELLRAAEDAGFDVMVSADKNIRYQQNLSGRKIALVVLSRSKWSSVEPVVSEVVAAVDAAGVGSYIEVTVPDDLFRA
jgi:hypothetical protein